jgi:branched-chain amino acid transport system permease protein
MRAALPFDRRLLKPRTGGLLTLAAAAVLAPLMFPNDFYYSIGTSIFITALAVVGLNTLMGFAGQVSLGHAGFFGIGAYAAAIGPTHLGLTSWVSLLSGVALACVTAWVIGRPILRLRGHYLAVASLGFGILIAMAFGNEAQWTGGPDGMSVPRAYVLGIPLRGAQTWYWTSAAVLVAGTWLALNVDESPSGRALKALHDSEVAAATIGIDVARYKLLALVISAAYTSLAGALAALSDGHVTPGAAGFVHSIELVAMAVLGGLGSVFGSIIGAALLKALSQGLTVLHDYEPVVLGLIMMLVMIFLPQGVVPSLARRLHSLLRTT